jgi:pimeloyl-ACP methyl ester carboxylesterase
MATAGVPRTANEAVARYVKFLRHVGAPQAPGCEEAWRAYAREAWERSGGEFDATGIARQIGAIQKSGDRTEQLRRIRAPTLVIHGDVDLLVAPSGGRATVEAIPGARLVVVDGMRHDIDAIRAPQVARLVLSHIRS